MVQLTVTYSIRTHLKVKHMNFEVLFASCLLFATMSLVMLHPGTLIILSDLPGRSQPTDLNSGLPAT